MSTQAVINSACAHGAHENCPGVAYVGHEQDDPLYEPCQCPCHIAPGESEREASTPSPASRSLSAALTDERARSVKCYRALRALHTIALNGVVCTPPDTWDDPFLGGDGSGRWFDIDAMTCPECRRAWKLVEEALALFPRAGQPVETIGGK